MNIALACFKYSSAKTFPQDSVRLAEELHKRGHRVTLYCSVIAEGSQLPPYLKVKLQMTESREVEKHRNADGKKYKPCEICGTKNNHFVYFTEWGDRYHSKTDCETIQRTVFVVPLSQVEGRTACSKCGG